MIGLAVGLAVRPLAPQVFRAAAAIHMVAFRGFYLTALGPRFLGAYYQLAMKYDGGICIGAFAGGTLAGFVVGFVDPPGFYQQLRSTRFRLGLAALPALLANPARVKRFLVNYQRTSGMSETSDRRAITAELTSLAVHPRYEGQGIGSSLVRAFVAGAPARGANHVMLTTDASDNEMVNRFYIRQGFHIARSFEAQPGRYLNQYEITAHSNGACDAR